MSPVTLHDCWNKIGVAGDRSCERLAEHVHCRNCEVYAGAARSSLSRPVDQAYRDEWARQLRQPERGADLRDSSGLVFRVGAEWLMLPTAMVLSVAPRAPGHKVPHRSGGALAGIVNVAGTIHPAVALDLLLGIDGNAGAAVVGRHVFARLLLVRWEGRSFAIPVADLHGVLRYAGAALQPPAATINKGIERFLTGVLAHQGMMIGVLDAALIGHQMTRLLQ